MNENSQIKEIISFFADSITIIGLIWATIYGLVKKHRNVLGYKINEFIVSMFKLALIFIAGIIFYYLSSVIFSTVLILIKGEEHGVFWEKGNEFAFIVAYFISGSIGLTFFWLLSTIIWTGSFIYCKNVWDISKIKKLFETYNSSSKLYIENAVYETPTKSIDVTDKLKKMIKNNQLTITASNDLAGDPEWGKEKTLVIRYRFGNESSKLIEIPELKTLTIKHE